MVEAIELRLPVATDGKPVFELVNACPPLDVNSMYCNLLQCDHFAATSVAAEFKDSQLATASGLAGFISGYVIPDRPDTLFVWQVAVNPAARGCGLALSMLKHLLKRPACKQVTHLETSITPDNQASWALFRKLARECSASINESVMFDRDSHFGGAHDTESLVRIGPFQTAAISAPAPATVATSPAATSAAPNTPAKDAASASID
ncbi:L-2,4-diaminobutyric acid acetyltransferase [BD1-7 clade bacterium]|uniref:L-2,4-diaminobutyric acid acetyltransferase n=1 Tax=BD1-7 clade bacterium TaxID=2029982 RepID=A0A5S9QRG8_9GAMM|nr:L-2,4-diaminobutyric acid acetyltransferase [BD1-7 clade bacterium]CAA0121583.1 L-2,4-diaminobutyric acid acetyltransferase [BD1-7 clade bacterium]